MRMREALWMGRSQYGRGGTRGRLASRGANWNRDVSSSREESDTGAEPGLGRKLE